MEILDSNEILRYMCNRPLLLTPADVLKGLKKDASLSYEDITTIYNRFANSEITLGHFGRLVFRINHKPLTIDWVKYLLLDGLMPTPMPSVEESQLRKSIRSNMPSVMDAVAGVTVQDDKPKLDKYSNKYETVPDLPPMPERKPKLVIHIEIDNNDLDNAVMEFEGNIVDAVEALYIAGKYNESMIKSIIGAAAMLVVDDPSRLKMLNDTITFFASPIAK